jgi:hypothetical protein
MVIGREEDHQLLYARKVAPNVSFRRYKLDFHLLPATV